MLEKTTGVVEKSEREGREIGGRGLFQTTHTHTHRDLVVLLCGVCCFVCEGAAAAVSGDGPLLAC